MAYYHTIDIMLERNAKRISSLKRAQDRLFEAFNAAYDGNDTTARDLVNEAKDIIDEVTDKKVEILP